MSIPQLITRDDMILIGRFLTKELSKELIYQKHSASGQLINSLEHRVVATGKGGLSLQIWAEDYGLFLNSGRKPGGRRVPIVALIEWVKRKSFVSGDKAVRSVAYAIQEKIYREGTPTEGSRRIAGRRVGWIDYTLDLAEPHIISVLEKRFQDNVRRSLDEQIVRINKQLRQAA